MKARINKFLLTLTISFLFFTSIGFGVATAYMYYERDKTADKIKEKDTEIESLNSELDQKNDQIQKLKESLGEFKGKLSVLEQNATNTQPKEEVTTDTNTTTKLTTDKVISRVKELSSIVPKGDPILAVIEDVTALKKDDAAFYADAKSGDYLVVFDNVKIIYRESLDKIINTKQL